MEQVHEQEEHPQSSSTPQPKWSFEDVVDIAIVFGGLPALVLNILMWAVATAFGGGLATVFALLITILMELAGIVLLVHYLALAVTHTRAYNAEPTAGPAADRHFNLLMGGWIASIFLVVCMIGSLSVAGQLEGWHYVLMGAELAMVGYQTWRAFTSRE